jgi:hypothetical protein
MDYYKASFDVIVTEFDVFFKLRKVALNLGQHR